MPKPILVTLLLCTLFAGCAKEATLPSPEESTQQKLQSNVWKANRFYNAADTFEKDYPLIKSAAWSFEDNHILRQTGWLMADPITLKDELVCSYQLEQQGTRIRSRYPGFEEDDVWQIVRLTPDTLTVKRLAPLFPNQLPAYLEFLPLETPSPFPKNGTVRTPAVNRFKKGL